MLEFIKKNKNIIICFVAVFLISLLFPYSGDDWQWKCGSLSWETIQGFSSNSSLNGRYFGNIMVIIMTENIILRGFFMALVLTIITTLIHKETKVSNIFIWALIISMPIDILKQSIIWTSGFTNYVISACFLLIDIFILRKMFDKRFKWYSIILTFILFFSSCLFIENLTVFLILATVILNVIYLVKYKKINLSMLFSFLGTLLGCFTMFSHPAYRGVADGSDGYRTIGKSITDIFSQVNVNLTETIHKFIAFDNLLLIILMSLFLFIYFYKKKDSYKKTRKRIIEGLFVYQFMYIFYTIVSHLNLNWQFLLSYTTIFNTYTTILYCVIIMISVCLIFDKKTMGKILIPLITIVGLVAPLCIVTPIGGRNFFMIYILEVMFICYLYKETGLEKYALSNKIIALYTIIILGYLLSIYGYIRKIDIKRTDYILEEVENGSKEIDVPYLPYNGYVWVANFDSAYYGPMFKAIYHIDNGVVFNFMPYS